jgi:hypothetical protein
VRAPLRNAHLIATPMVRKARRALVLLEGSCIER